MHSDPPSFVLDTNIVLDWLVFRDRATHELSAAIDGGRVQVLVHECTLEELERVLAYPQFELGVREQREVLVRYRSAAKLASMPDGFSRHRLLLPFGFPRCRDRDDQIFLAVAYHARANGLVTKDRAVLGLRHKARRFGVAILAPLELPSIPETKRK